MDSVLTLIKTERQQDDYGRWKATETEQQIFCQVTSIGANEFYEAGRNGLNPQYRFLVFQGDYSGEELCEYEGLRYTIYRTYRRDDVVELYVERRGGSNGTAQDHS